MVCITRNLLLNNKVESLIKSINDEIGALVEIQE